MESSNMKAALNDIKIEDGRINPLKRSLINEYLKGNCNGQGVPLKEFISYIERDAIVRALKISRGSQRIASFILGMKPTTLNEKIKRLDIHQAARPRSIQDLKLLLEEIDIQAL